jgi:hypothetical protein
VFTEHPQEFASIRDTTGLQAAIAGNEECLAEIQAQRRADAAKAHFRAARGKSLDSALAHGQGRQERAGVPADQRLTMHPSGLDRAPVLPEQEELNQRTSKKQQDSAAGAASADRPLELQEKGDDNCTDQREAIKAMVVEMRKRLRFPGEGEQVAHRRRVLQQAAEMVKP